MCLPQVQWTVSLGGREFHKLLPLFASGQRPAAALRKTGYNNENAKSTGGPLRSRPRPKRTHNEDSILLGNEGIEDLTCGNNSG